MTRHSSKSNARALAEYLTQANEEMAQHPPKPPKPGAKPGKTVGQTTGFLTGFKSFLFSGNYWIVLWISQIGKTVNSSKHIAQIHVNDSKKHPYEGTGPLQTQDSMFHGACDF